MNHACRDGFRLALSLQYVHFKCSHCQAPKRAHCRAAVHALGCSFGQRSPTCPACGHELTMTDESFVPRWCCSDPTSTAWLPTRLGILLPSCPVYISASSSLPVPYTSLGLAPPPVPVYWRAEDARKHCIQHQITPLESSYSQHRNCYGTSALNLHYSAQHAGTSMWMARQQLATLYRTPRASPWSPPGWAISPPGAVPAPLPETLPDGPYHPQRDGIEAPLHALPICSALD
eukprot:364968-Chlamydomonas_euryale.AAC.17